MRYRCTIMKEFNNLGLSSANSSDELKMEKKESGDDLNNIENNKEDEKEENIEEKNENIKISVKFNNKTNIPDINLDGEDLNQLDEEIN